MPNVGYEVRRSSLPDGGVKLELLVEGKRIATATAELGMIDAISELLGLERESVITDMEGALVDVLKAQAQAVRISTPAEHPTKQLLFFSRYTYTAGDLVTVGVVWYDLKESTTGPDAVPPVVRNQMRHEVHRMLTDPASAARKLIDRG